MLAFTLDDIADGLVAAALSCELAIGVRSGCFCAHPGVSHLLQLDVATGEYAPVGWGPDFGDYFRL